MTLIRMALAMGLPWLAGIVWLRYRWRAAPEGAWPMSLGYGYIAGMLATTLIMRAMDVIGIHQGVLPIGLTLVGLIGLGLWFGRDIAWLGWAGGIVTSGWRAQASWQKVVIVLMMAALMFRYLVLGSELLWRPLFAWDAWATWAPKARVWFELRTLAPFVDWGTWIVQDPVEAYTMAAHHYPPTIPLIQVWTSLALGRWDDSLMNLPWVACGAALGLAFYGQARLWGIGPLPASLVTYGLLSLPLVNAHVALAGNADLWMAAVYGLAAMAFFQWLRNGEARQGILALGLALACTQIKVPGLVWMLTFVPALWIPRLTKRIVVGASVVCVIAVVVWLVIGGFSMTLPGWGRVTMTPEILDAPYLGSYRLSYHPEVWGAVFESYFSLATWHLFWYLWPVGFLWNLRLVLSRRLYASMALLVMGSFAFVISVYFFTPLATFAVDFTQLNRATLHMVPMLSFVAVTLVADRAGADRVSEPSRGQH